MKKVTRSIPEKLTAHPSVYALGDEYQIMVACECEMLVGATVGGETYYDEYNGVKRSSDPIHRVRVPMEELDAARGYTLILQEVKERKAYRSDVCEPVYIEYGFTPLTKAEGIRLYHISDTHGKVDLAIEAAEKAWDIDVLILNGDVMNSSQTLSQIVDVYRIAGAITEGTLPCVFSRGNHDFRGVYAEKLSDFVPAYNGNTYFTFRVGPIFGLVLDCGEDKFDDHEEYGSTVCCDAFRKRETRFLEGVLKARNFYDEGVKYRLVISHVPFAQRPGKGNYGYVENPFLVGEELYTEWCKRLREDFSPDLMICGHVHQCEVCAVGGKRDQRGQPANLIVGGKPKTLSGERDGVSAAMITLKSDCAEVVFNDNEGAVTDKKTVRYGCEE